MVSTSTRTEATCQGQPYSYDEVPYESVPFSQSHPDRLASAALLFGLEPTPIGKCRVLELGCASGGNLIPMACLLPGSHFIGIELSGRQASQGMATIKELGLKNIEIKHMNLMDVHREMGPFDYIITHGVYSWVPEKVQGKILQICQDHLTANGIAYISYNTYPGWHFRGMLREMMLYHTASIGDQVAKAGKALRFLDFLAESAPVDSTAFGIKPFQAILSEEAAFLRKQRQSYVIHEHLADTNLPLYFHQFVERAALHGLQYLGESEYNTMLIRNLPEKVGSAIRQISGDVITTEQYMDFVKNRTFRQTLLCRKEQKIDRKVTADRLKQFHIASPAKPLTPAMDIHAPRREPFEYRGAQINIPSALVKAAFLHLSEIHPRSLPFYELLSIARSKLNTPPVQEGTALENDAALLASDLLVGLEINLVSLRTQQDAFVSEVSEYPIASALARHQAKTADHVTNLLHESIHVDALSRHLLELLDGSRNRGHLLHDLSMMAKNGPLIVHREGKVVREPELAREVIAPAMSERLSTFARSALLIG